MTSPGLGSRPLRAAASLGDEPLLVYFYLCVAAMAVISALVLSTGIVDAVIGAPVLIMPALVLSLSLGFAATARRVGVSGLLVFNLLTGGLLLVHAPYAWGVHTVSLSSLQIYLFSQAVLGSARSAVGLYGVYVAGLTAVFLLPPDRLLALQNGPEAQNRYTFLLISASFCLVVGLGVGRALRRRIQESARRGERYGRLLTDAPVGIALHRNGLILEVNQAFRQMLRWPADETLTGRPIVSMHHPDDVPIVAGRMADLAQRPSGAALPARQGLMLAADGTVVPMQVFSSQVPMDDGPAVLSFYSDETERRTTEAARRDTQNLLEAVIEQSPFPMSLVEYDTGFVRMVNSAWCETLGFSREEVLGTKSLKLPIWGDRDKLRWLLEHLHDEAAQRDHLLPMITRNGRRRLLRLSIAPVQVDGRLHVLSVGKDITDERSAEIGQRVILESVDSAIVLQHGGRIVQASAALERLVGWPTGTAAGRLSAEAIGGVEVERRAFAMCREDLLAGRPVSFELDIVRVDGRRVPCLFRGRRVDLDDERELRATVWVLEDLSQRREVERNLVAARDAAEAASKAKGHFLATMSHEIRTPLNGIVGLTDLLRAGGLSEGQRLEYLEMLDQSARSLMGTLSGVLDLSKIESGHLEIDRQPFDLMELLEGLRATYETLAFSRGLGFAADLAPGLRGPRLGDMVRVRQVLQNFLSNALKFAGAGPSGTGSIRLVARPVEGGGDRVRIMVSDTGPGVPPALQEQIFQAYRQVEGTDRTRGGTGLGLAICRELATLLGGQVGLDSREGAGAEFWVELPLPRLQPPVAAAAANAAAQQPGLPFDDEAGGPAVSAAAPRTTASPAAALLQARVLEGFRVLMVDDNRVNRVVARRVLERAGAEVVEAVDGLDGLSALEASLREGRLVDVVLMDLNMPRLDGMSATRRLRMHPHPKVRELPVLALTAAVLEQERQDAFDAGMNDFLTKPINVATLCRAIERARPGRKPASSAPSSQSAQPTTAGA